MIKNAVEAVVKWLPPEQGGKKNITSNIRYNPLIFFDGINFGEVTWSADIFIKDLNDNLESNVLLSFLVEWAPFELLKSGQSFKLCEGAKTVANGKVR